MARQLILIVRCCFKQLKAEQNMDRGGRREKRSGVGQWGEKLHGKLERLNFSLSFTTLFPQLKTLLMWIHCCAEQTQL